MCPRCAGESGQLYTGQLRGVLYDAHRRRGTGADDCLCRLCQQRPAAAWDHCHEHGCIRGPLCGSCNTREGTGLPYYFLRLEGGAASPGMPWLSRARDLAVPVPHRRRPRVPGTGRAAGSLPSRVLRPRAGARPRCGPVRAGVQRMARQPVDEGRGGARDSRARAGFR
ncbi:MULTISPECIES: endonuclease domain-containing protein [Streptomyces]|uniref:endonuclease domain-containing protein n=1 Tax=Streptomyces tendae TaxID=1932 RepID=UPI00380C5F41